MVRTHAALTPLENPRILSEKSALFTRCELCDDIFASSGPLTRNRFLKVFGGVAGGVLITNCSGTTSTGSVLPVAPNPANVASNRGPTTFNYLLEPDLGQIVVRERGTSANLITTTISASGATRTLVPGSLDYSRSDIFSSRAVTSGQLVSNGYVRSPAGVLTHHFPGWLVRDRRAHA